MVAAAGRPVAAQDTTTVVDTVPAVPVRDTARARARPLGPKGAFLRSFLLPGWGQIQLDRKLSAGLFIAWEGVTLGMTIQKTIELNDLKRQNADPQAIKDKRNAREDWIVLLVFNHLAAGVEAFVASHLADFPEDVKLRAVPMATGATGFGLTVPVRFR